MILCEKCKKNVATVHLTEIHSGKKDEKHLCEECAQSMHLTQKHTISISDLIGALMEKGPRRGSGKKGRACPDCGLTFGAFRNKGRLGCPHDYEFFKEEFDELLKKVHGSNRYVGKVPRGYGDADIRHNELIRLKTRLKKAVQAENYEEAARIRDKIKELEEKILEDGNASQEVSG